MEWRKLLFLTFYHMMKGYINPGLLAGLNSGVNGLVVCYCDTWPAGQHSSLKKKPSKVCEDMNHYLNINSFYTVVQEMYAHDCEQTAT
jgi:hypothetical protein